MYTRPHNVFLPLQPVSSSFVNITLYEEVLYTIMFRECKRVPFCMCNLIFLIPQSINYVYVGHFQFAVKEVVCPARWKETIKSCGDSDRKAGVFTTSSFEP